jgi:glycerate dehydrogenase
MKIVVLDGHALNPGDLSWDEIRACGELSVHPRTPASDIITRAAGAEVLLTNKTPLDAATFAALPALRYVGVLATGYNVVDVRAARARGVVVSNAPGYGTDSVAQHAFALLLELASRTGHHAATVAAGRWASCPDYCYWDHPVLELSGRTMGIVGYGRIGRATARIAAAFGMNVIAHTPRPPASGDGVVRFTDVDTLFREADVVSLHCPLTPENTGLVDARRLALMKPTAYLINTSRGPLVNETDLAAALNSGRIAGAGLDVLSVEPPAADHPLFSVRNCVITPHLAWASVAARRRLLGIVAANLRAFMDGTPANVVS